MAALFFPIALLAFVAPGLWLARRWWSGPERWLAGGALGYVISSLAASVLYRFGGLESGWLALSALPLVLRGGRAAHREAFHLAAALLLGLAIVAAPFARVGERLPEGIAYRAYFSADLMTHLSVVAELQKGDFPPQNPFLAGEPLAYYWLFFLFPALVGGWMGNQQALLLTALAGTLCFCGLAFYAARRLAGAPSIALLAVFAGIAATSFEGVASLVAAPSFRDLNVDAFSRWVLELVSLDGLHRALLYTPQHLLSYSLLLLLIGIVLGGGPRGAGSSALSGLLLGGMAGMSIVTAMLAGPWLVLVRWRRGGTRRELFADLSVLAGASLGLLLWYVALGFFGGAGAALVLRAPRLAEIPSLLLLEAGALFLLSLPALARRPELSSLAGIAFAAVLFLDLAGYEGVWMAWRAGSVLLVCLMLIAAAALPRWPKGAVAALVLLAAPTTLLDVYNAQDVHNRRESAGEFRWTTVVRADELAALAWIRRATPREAVVQWDVRARGPAEWALVPAIAERRMAVGFPIFLLDGDRYRSRERRAVRPIFTDPDAARSHRLAVAAGIDYLVVGRPELEVRGERVRKFWQAPELFREVFANAGVSVFEVRGKTEPETARGPGRAISGPRGT